MRWSILGWVLLPACAAEDTGLLLPSPSGDAALVRDATPWDVATPPEAGVDGARIEEEPDGGRIDAGGDPVLQAIADLALAECAFEARCREAVAALFNRHSELSCVEAQVASWTLRFDSKRQQGAGAEALIGQAGDCAMTFGDSECWVEPFAIDSACWRASRGEREVGGGCAWGPDCRSGSCSIDDPELGCGECLPARLAGEVCDVFHGCAGGLECAPTEGPDDRCLRVSGIGDACTGPLGCAGMLFCSFNQGQTCARPAEILEPCTTTPTEEAHCAAERLLACREMRCARAQYVGEGEVCDDLHWCDFPFGRGECDALLGRCVAFAQSPIGGGCSNDFDCEQRAICVPFRRCEARREEGEACESHRECESPLRCLGAPKACRHFEWHVCE